MSKTLEEYDVSNLFSLYKTIYSALIISDSIATGVWKGRPSFEFQAISEKNVVDWINTFEDMKEKLGIKKLESSVKNIPLDSLRNINEIRTRIFLDSEENFISGIKKKKRVFYFQAPTGSGKTNCSINFMLKVLMEDKSIKRGFFVFPFINIIEQNVNVIRTSLGISDSSMLEVHSLADWKMDDEVNESSNLDKYYDDRIFLNGKICAISQVTFFEALGNSSKNKSYPYCFLSNSIIVIDEIQAIQDGYWPFIANLIDKLAYENNCYVVLMSATLPKVDQYKKLKLQCPFSDLLPEAENFQRNSLFSSRTEIICRLEIQTNEQILSFLQDEIILDSSSPQKILLVVNTIKRAQTLFELIKSTIVKDFEICLLHSQLLPHKKIEIVQKSKLKDKKLILISTQSIEAGIDADFDIGIRDMAILDSMEQVAGRINREGSKKSRSKLFIVSLRNNFKADSGFIYGQTNRWDYLSKHLTELERIKLIENRQFEDYYLGVNNYIETKLHLPSGHDVKERRILDWSNTLNFYNLRNFRLIKDEKETCFIPINIEINSGDFERFSTSELSLIRSIDESALQNGFVIGEKIWRIYESISDSIHKSRDQKIHVARFNSILSKFLASRRKKQNEKLEKPIRYLPLDQFVFEYDIETGFKNLDDECVF